MPKIESRIKHPTDHPCPISVDQHEIAVIGTQSLTDSQKVWTSELVQEVWPIRYKLYVEMTLGDDKHTNGNNFSYLSYICHIYDHHVDFSVGQVLA